MNTHFKYYLTIGILAGFNFSLAADKKLPDFSKAFPKQHLVLEMGAIDLPADGSKPIINDNYTYLSDMSFNKAEKKFVKFIGSGWKAEKPDADYKQLKKHGNYKLFKILDSMIYTHPDFKFIQIDLTHTLKKGKGRKPELNITVFNTSYVK